MKRLMVIAALAVAPLACVANQGDAPVRFIHARALDPDCKIVEDSYVSSGSLDVSGGQNYRLVLAVETNTSTQQITIGQEIFSGNGLGDITLNELIYSYESQPSGAVPEEERVPIYAVYRPGTDAQESTFTVGGFGPQALDRLKGLPVDASVTVLSTIKGRGVMSGGQIVESNEITFPITVVNSGFVPGTPPKCPGDRPGTPAGLCVLGQDVGRICP
jgi:hypothetical protein